MGEITREDFNGLGKRVNDVDKDFIACRAEKGEIIKQLKETSNEIKEKIGELFDGHDALRTSFGSFSNKIIGAVVVLNVFIVIGVVILQKVWK